MKLVRKVPIFATVLAPVLAVPFSVLPAIAAPSVTWSDSVTYVEGDEPVDIASSFSLSNGSSYDGGYLEFEVDSAGVGDVLAVSLSEDAFVANDQVTAVDLGNGEISLYLGVAGVAVPIGSVDQTNDGESGRALRIRFVNSFSNAGFEADELDGWTIYEDGSGNRQFILGSSEIDGVTSVDGRNYAQMRADNSNRCTYDTNDNVRIQANGDFSSASFTAAPSTDKSTEGTQSLKISMNVTSRSSGGWIIHGPAVYSEEFEAGAGDDISFDWNVVTGGDKYAVYGYIQNVDTGASIEVIDAWQLMSGAPASNTWNSASATISTAGTYRFVFMGGAHNADCGSQGSSTLYIDNINVFGSRVTDSVASKVAQLVTYRNTLDNPPSTRTVNVTAVAADSSLDDDNSISVSITPVNDAPSIDGDGSTTSIAVSLSETDASSEDNPIANATGTLSAVDPDNDSPTFTYGVTGGTTSGSNISKAGTYGTLTVNSSTGAYTYVPNMVAIKPLNDGDSPTDTFGLTVSDGSLSGSGSLVFTINGNSPPSINSPSIQSFEPSTSATAIDNDFVIAGFDGTVLVSIGLSNAASGTGFALPNFASSGALRGAGFSAANPASSMTDFSMTGTQAQINSALAGMTITTGTTRSNFSFNVSASAQQAGIVQSGVTQSFYEYVSSANTSWDAAKAAAEARTFAGVNGYLVTITSAGENAFVKDRISGATNVWIGASDAAEEGVWKWVTGPEGENGGTTFFLEGPSQADSDDQVVTYASWSSGEPNDASGEDVAVTNWNSATGTWNDLAGTNSGSVNGYVVEYSEWNGQSFSTSSVAKASSTVSMGGPVLSGTAAPVSAQLSWTVPTRSGQTVSSYAVTSVPSVGGQSTVCSGAATSCTVTGLTAGTSYAFTVTATWSDSNTSASNSVTVTALAATTSSGSSGGSTTTRVAQPLPPTVIPPRAFTPPQVTLPTAQSGPVLRGGLPPTPPRAPSVLLGGRPTTVTTTVPSTTQLDVRAGTVNLGVRVQEDQGEISQAPDGATEIAVRKGSAATITGTGFRPGATVQVFMPLAGDNAKELTRIPVQPDGSFDGSAPFATRPNEAPLPIGKNVLQLVSLDNDGNQVVVEMAVNIAQGAPAPEQNRIDGVIPAMAPGQSVATSGGEPVPVTITPVSEQKLAVVEGDGWSMAINVAAEDGGVEPSEGGALLKLVRDESAVISGSGFMPGTRADVWLFSDPTLLGTVTIDEDGEFTGEVNIDPNMIPVGEHTLQLQGVGEDGYVKAANLGVLVDDAVEAAPTAVEQGLGFIWWVIAALVLLAVIVVLVASRRRRDA